MTDHKTVREALEFYATSWVNNSYGSADGSAGKRLLADKGKRATEALAALDRIEAVETVTVEDVIQTLMTGSHGALNPKHVRWDVDALFKKYPNGLRITKEK